MPQYKISSRVAVLFACALCAAAPNAPAWAQEEGPRYGPQPVYERASAAFRAVFSGKKSSLSALHVGGRDTLLADLAVWGKLIRDERDDSWGALSALITRRPHWPGATGIRRRAEWLMPQDLPSAQVRAFFADDTPLTARGARLLGEALIAQGRNKDGALWIVRGWREYSTPKSEAQTYLNRHSALLKPHHAARIDFLIHRERLSEAQRLSKSLPREMRVLTAARVALLRRKGNVDQLVAAVPAKLQKHPGLLHARMTWRDKKGRREGAEELMLQASAPQNDLGDPDRWTRRRLIFARDAYEDGRFQDAYNLAEAHQLSNGVNYADLEWFAGWVALRHIGDAQNALKLFSRMYDSVGSPISLGRAAYWAGEAADALGRADEAKMWRERAAEHPSVYYGQLAAEQLGVKPNFRPDLTQEASSPPPWSSVDRDLARAARALYDYGLKREARLFINRLAARQTDAAQMRAVARIAQMAKDPAGRIRVGKAARKLGLSLYDALFPIPETPGFINRRSEAPLLLAIARQESEFSPSAQSGAGALGMMQMMPATAKSTARSIGVSFDPDRLTRDPQYILNLADAHVTELLDDYDGSYVLTIAAYNAGGRNVSRWIKRFGDPRDPNVNVVDWVESIPFSETRNYVQRVLESVQVYRSILADSPLVLELSKDLER